MCGQSDIPTGKYMSTIKIGPKGQIVIPKEVRQLYHLQPGDSLLLLADRSQGIALVPQSRYEEIAALFSKAFSLVFPEEAPS